MERRVVLDLLEAVARGDRMPEQAAEQLARLPVDDLGFARVDNHRELRTGVPEAIFAPSKTPAEVRRIAESMLAEPGGAVVVTRASAEQAAALEGLGGTWYERSGTVVLRTASAPPAGTVTVVAAGTADRAVAEEAEACAGALGCAVESVTDVGVAGIHRLLAAEERLRSADVLIVVAGMEGALPSAVAGMVRAPVVAVPTSVGYGASFGGLAALLGMLTSCAPGISVVNIDNGFGAAAVASRILEGRR